MGIDNSPATGYFPRAAPSHIVWSTVSVIGRKLGGFADQLITKLYPVQDCYGTLCQGEIVMHRQSYIARSKWLWKQKQDTHSFETWSTTLVRLMSWQISGEIPFPWRYSVNPIELKAISEDDYLCRMLCPIHRWMCQIPHLPFFQLHTITLKHEINEKKDQVWMHRRLREKGWMSSFARQQVEETLCQLSTYACLLSWCQFVCRKFFEM